MHIEPIPAFQDNYIWCLSEGNNAALVDPGDAVPALAYLKANQLNLTDIMITHHHADHIGGLGTLLQSYPDVAIYGADSGRIPHVTDVARAGSRIELKGLPASFEVIPVPGHTLDHIAYYGDAGLFCGDTLFSAGCGRLFEGTPAQMHQSLAKFSALPNNTTVYCTHEYTLANLDFARAVEGSNVALQDYQRWAKARRQSDLPTLPTNMGEQKAINPFLRTSQPEVKAAAKSRGAVNTDDEIEVFAAIRRWKDNF